jgi:uncharacterized protein (DUF1499 family)
MSEIVEGGAPPPARARLSRLAVAAAAVGIAAWVMLGVSGPGTRAELWDFRAGFRLMTWGAYLGIAAVVLGIVAAAVARPGAARRGFGVALIGVLLGATALALPWSLRRTARSVPPIHDITTDVANPPEFVAVAPLREDAPNPVAYEGDSIAALQQAAYPDVGPVMLALPPDSAFALALATAEGMGWEMVAVDRAAGRIEATAVTTWFGFLDDVVIRVSPASGISRVDVRSKSRVGRSDVGANAKRIRRYTRDLRERAGDDAA